MITVEDFSKGITHGKGKQATALNQEQWLCQFDLHHLDLSFKKITKSTKKNHSKM